MGRARRFPAVALVISAGFVAFGATAASGQTTTTVAPTTTVAAAGTILVNCGSPIPQQLDCIALVTPGGDGTETFHWSVDGDKIDDQTTGNLLLYTLPAGRHIVEVTVEGRATEPGQFIAELSEPNIPGAEVQDFPWATLGLTALPLALLFVVRLNRGKRSQRS